MKERLPEWKCLHWQFTYVMWSFCCCCQSKHTLLWKCVVTTKLTKNPPLDEIDINHPIDHIKKLKCDRFVRFLVMMFRSKQNSYIRSGNMCTISSLRIYQTIIMYLTLQVNYLISASVILGKRKKYYKDESYSVFNNFYGSKKKSYSVYKWV